MRTLATLLLLSVSVSPCLAQWERAAEQIPDLKSLPDMTAELQSQIDQNSGTLLLTAENYRITSTLEFDLKTLGAAAVKSIGGSTIIMDGAGPAIRFTGTHEGTASPSSFKPATWNERMPIVTGIEILGAHPEADGIELRQSSLSAVVPSRHSPGQSKPQRHNFRLPPLREFRHRHVP
jgi:hypothetical protein